MCSASMYVYMHTHIYIPMGVLLPELVSLLNPIVDVGVLLPEWVYTPVPAAPFFMYIDMVNEPRLGLRTGEDSNVG